MTPFFNTIQESGDQLHQSCIRAKSLESKVLDFFRSAPGRHFTPPEVNKYFPEYPLTSVRRAMTNLSTSKNGEPALLEKTELLTPGLYGKNNFNWRLAGYHHEQRELF